MSTTPLKQERWSDFASATPSFARDLWAAKRAKADFVIATAGEEVLHGDNLDLSLDEIIAAEDKKPYGDVTYADPGYQKDGKKRYPINTESHIRAAWSYINQEKNHAGYTASQVSAIKSRIVSAWKRVIDKSGPPSAAK